MSAILQSSEQKNDTKQADVERSIKWFEDEGDALVKSYSQLEANLKNKAFPNKATEMFYRLPLNEKQRAALYERLTRGNSGRIAGKKKDPNEILKKAVKAAIVALDSESRP